MKTSSEGGVAYHVVVNGLEGLAGWTPMSQFASTVGHTLSGHLPHHRYRAAGRARKRDGAAEGARAEKPVERSGCAWCGGISCRRGSISIRMRGTFVDQGARWPLGVPPEDAGAQATGGGTHSGVDSAGQSLDKGD